MSKRRVIIQMTLDLRAVALLSVVFLLLGLIIAPTVAGAFPRSDDPEPLYDAKNADKVDGLHASRRPNALTLLALNKNKKFPAKVLPAAITRDKEVMPIVKANINDVLPSGVIVMWSGAIEDIPEGWALCDGTNGSPDLRDRFVYGVSQGEDPGTTGGSELHNHAYIDLPIHTHVASSVEAGTHTHTYVGHAEEPEQRLDADQAGPWFSPYAWNYTTSEAGNHTHVITVDPAGEVTPLSTSYTQSAPRFYRLAFIIKL